MSLVPTLLPTLVPTRAGMPRPTAPDVDPGLAFGRLTRAVSVLTTGAAPEQWHGTTIDSLTLVSAGPPLVLVSVGHGSRTALLVGAAGAFAVSVLAADQVGVARWFASRRRGSGAAQFAAAAQLTGGAAHTGGVGHRAGPHTGAPLLAGALAWLECAVVSLSRAGDHTLVLGEVRDAVAGDSPRAAPLLRQAGGYGTFDSAAGRPATAGRPGQMAD